MPSDRIETMLESLASGTESPAPPAAFLGKVRTRARRRKALQFGYALGLTLAACVLTVVFVRPPAPISDAAPPAPIAASLDDHSIFVLGNANAGSSDVVLPEPVADAPAEILTIGHRPDPDDVAAWVGGS